MDEPRSEDKVLEAVPAELDRSVTVDLGGGLRALLGEVLDAANPDCRFCSGGVQTYHKPDGKCGQRLCGCGVVAVRRRLRGDPVPAPAARVVTGNGEHARKKLARLEAALKEAEEERDRKLRGCEEALSAAASRKSHAAYALEEARASLAPWSRATALAQAALHAAEEALRGAVDDEARECAKLEGFVRAYNDTCEQVSAAEQGLATVRESMHGIVHRADRLRTRLALHRQQHPELGKSS